MCLCFMHVSECKMRFQSGKNIADDLMTIIEHALSQYLVFTFFWREEEQKKTRET